MFHDEVDRIATGPASEALVDPLAFRNAERGRLLVVKRAQAPEIRTLLLKMDKVTHDLFHTGSLEYQVYGLLRDHGVSKVLCKKTHEHQGNP
jgi:hypothetical protein